MSYTRTRNFGGAIIPTATRVHAFSCGDPKCGSVHLIGFDEEDEPLFEIVVSKEVYKDMGVLFEGFE